MKKLIISLFSILLLFPVINLSAQEEKEEEVEIKVSLTKSDDNISVTIDTTTSNIDFDLIQIDSIVNSVFEKMEDFDIHFSIDSTINEALIWIEDSLSSDDRIKYIDEEIIQEMKDLENINIDSLMSANMILIKSTIDSLTDENLFELEIFADSLAKCHEFHVIKMTGDMDMDFDIDYIVDTIDGEIEKHVFYFSGDENTILKEMGENVHVIKKMVKNSPDGESDITEITYEIEIGDGMELNEIDEDGNVIKKTIKKRVGEDGELFYDIMIEEETIIEEIDENGNLIKKTIRSSGDGDEGIQKIMIIDDGSSIKNSNIFIRESNMLEFEVFDLSKKEKSTYGDFIDIKGKERLKLNNMAIFPNPNNGRFRLSFDMEKNDPVSVKIFDTEGNLLFESETMNEEGKYSTRINLKSIDPGNYILKIQQGKKFKTKRLYIK